MRLCFSIFVLLCIESSIHALELKIEKQKLKLSMEYENFVDFDGNEVATPGVKATYLFKAKTDLRKILFVNVDYQTGLKGNFVTDFTAGELPSWMWSNRLASTVTIPVKNVFFGGTLFLRNNLPASVTDGNEFLDIFGGEQFREISGSFQAGVSWAQKWQISGALQKSDLRFKDFPLSDSESAGASVRLSRRTEKLQWNVDYRVRSIDYNRPIFFVPPNQLGDVLFPTDGSGDFLLQHDSFREVGGSVEFFHPFYLSAGYFYQNNRSNNPGFSYHNNRLTFLIGTELSPTLHLQAYGIASLQDFLQEDASLPFPLVPNENDNSSMAAALTKAFNNKHELEVGFQRLNYNSSFEELDTSKYILYVAFNFRF